MYDLVVVGAGTAGLTAALYALRAGKSVAVLEGNSFGGQIAYSPRVENFPTIKEIAGSEFADKLFDQVVFQGADVDMGEVLEVNKLPDDTFEAVTEYGKTHARAVVLATGVKHRHLNTQAEARLLGKGVFYCALCDGAFYKDHEMAVLGDGNTALQYALYLTGLSPKVHLITLTDKLMGDGGLQQRIFANDKIVWHKSVNLTDMKGETALEGVVLTHNDGSEEVLPVDALFVAIGQVPDNKRFSNLADLDSEGYFASGEDCMTKTEGVFVAGDCRAKAIRQLTTAAGDGAVAGTNAVNWLNK